MTHTHTKKLNMQREGDLVHAVMTYCTMRGHFVWRNNTGAFRGSYTDRHGDTRQRFHRFGHPGSSDVLGVHKNGQLIAIECKRRGNSPTPLQQQFLQEVGSRHGIAIVAFCIEDVMEHL